MSPTFFRNPVAFRRWLGKNHITARELWVGLVKRHAGKTGLTYSEALDQALCFGWIDGVRRRIDDHRWTIKRGRRLDPASARRFRAHKRAWAFFQTQPPSYRRTTQWWVMTAKQEATRRRRLAALIESSAKGARLGQFTRR